MDIKGVLYLEASLVLRPRLQQSSSSAATELSRETLTECNAIDGPTDAVPGATIDSTCDSGQHESRGSQYLLAFLDQLEFTL